MTNTMPCIGKQRFDDIYNLEKPDKFFHCMTNLNYRTPDYLSSSVNLMESFISECSVGDSITVLDLCCGYGLNSLILKYGLDMKGVVNFISAPQRNTEFASERCSYFTRHIDTANIRIVGADIADRALRYAQASRLIDEFICKNLEEDRLSLEEKLVISDVDIIISTGSLSYITARSIKAYLLCIDFKKPLLALFWPLLGHDASDIVTTLAAFDMEVVNESDTLHWHRAYASAHERESFFARYEQNGISYRGTLAEKGVCVTRLLAKRSRPRTSKSGCLQADR